MPIEVRVPATGESVAEATVGAWLKREGEQVQAGETLVELETDKVNVEVSAERSGRLERIERQTGDTVRPGDVLAILAEASGDGVAPASQAISQAARPLSSQPSPQAAQPAKPTEPVQAAPSAAESAPPPSPPQPAEAPDRPHASPLASRI